MRTIADIENPLTIIAWWNNRLNERPAYLYQSIFDLAYNPTDEIEMLYGQDHPAEMMTATTDDVGSVKRDNIGFETETKKLIPFKNYKAMNEKRRNEIKSALSNNSNAALVKAITDTQYKDPASLLTDALFTRETMAMQALTTGGITVLSDGVQYKRDFGIPDEHKVATKTPWGTMDSTPLTDIQDQVDKINDDNGTVIAYAIMNGRTFRKIGKSGEVINSLAIAKTSNNIAMSQSAVKSLFTDTVSGVTPLIYNKGVGSDRFIPDDVVVLIPEGGVGRMAWTDTNEDLGLAGDAKYQLSRTSEGITVYTKRVDDPVATMVHVSQKVLPTLDKARNIVIMNVAGSDSTTGEATTGTSDSGTDTVKN